MDQAGPAGAATVIMSMWITMVLMGGRGGRNIHCRMEEISTGKKAGRLALSMKPAP